MATTSRETFRCRMFDLLTFLILLISHPATVQGKVDSLKICVVGNPRVKTTHATKYCDLLEKSKNTPVSCVYEPDRLGCLWAVSNRGADFSVFEPEDLYFSTLLEENQVLVVGEIKELKKKRFHYGAVVVVRKNGNVTSIKDLAGQRLCHPGLESGPEWPYLFAQYLEERVAPANCEEGFTLYEDRIKTTSDFFGSACKAGPWVVDPDEDARLKKLYWNLCGLCDSGDCRIAEKYRGSGGSITCFKDRVGNVLWSKYEDVKIHIASEEKAESEYSFLCDDGSLMSITTDEPCIWLAKPWQVVAANRKSATSVQKVLESLKNDEHKEWQENLLHLIELYLQYVQNLAVLRTPEDYLRTVPGYLSASAMSESNCKPKHFVGLCLSSATEHLKCVWMSKAAASLGIRPSLDCVQKPNVTACLKSVEQRESDVVVVPPDHLADAMLIFHLKTFLWETGDHFNDSYLVSAVVKKNSNLKKVADLRGKRACFTRKNGIGWKAAVDVLRQEKLVRSECGDDEGLLDFFEEVCVIEKGEENLKSCHSSISGKVVNAESEAFHWLQKGRCDVAFLDLSYAVQNGEDGGKPERWESDVRTICRTNDFADCQWSWSHSGYLMMSPKAPRTKAEEAYSVFYQLGQLFGRNSRKNNAMLKVFGPFIQAKNVIFKDSSTSLQPRRLWNHTNNYEEMVKKMQLCSKSSSASWTWTLTFLSGLLVTLNKM